MTLLPFYNKESSYSIDDSFTKLLRNYNITSRKLGKAFHNSFPRFNLTELPKELKDVKIIPMDNLINRLQNLLSIGVISEFPNWVYSLFYFVIALLVGVAIFLCFKCRKRLRLPCSAKREGGKQKNDFAQKYDVMGQQLSAKTDGDVTTNRDVASAPMLGNPTDEIPNNVYPVLKLPLLEH